ncbi:MAG TPA: glycosyltransferase family 9 protein [Chloroflexota bacterium]
MLTTPIGASALEGLDSVNRLWVADKHRFDSPNGLLSPAALMQLGPLMLSLRRERYDQLLLLHHLTTWFGIAKYLLLTRAIGAARTVGLDNGRGFLDVGVPDAGFGIMHEVDCCLAVAEAAGATRPVDPRLEIAQPADGAKERWLALHAGSGVFSLARRWPPEQFAEVGRRLASRYGLQPVVIGTEVDREPSERLLRELDCGALDFVGEKSVAETAAILRRCHLLISNDSGAVHLAAAVGTPVVAVFGPSNDRAWGPYPPSEHRVVRATLPCSPCFYRGKSLGTPQGCATRDCLRLVTPDMVVAAAEELLLNQ